MIAEVEQESIKKPIRYPIYILLLRYLDNHLSHRILRHYLNFSNLFPPFIRNRLYHLADRTYEITHKNKIMKVHSYKEWEHKKDGNLASKEYYEVFYIRKGPKYWCKNVPSKDTKITLDELMKTHYEIWGKWKDKKKK